MKAIAGFLLGATLLLADSDVKVKMQELPPAVQKAAQEQLGKGTLAGVSKEVEHGRTFYEIETKVDGHTRDVLLDKTGALVSVEEESDIATIPEAARTALRKKAGAGKITKVEKVTAGSNVSYEAAILRNGRKSEAAVNADGSPHKE